MQIVDLFKNDIKFHKCIREILDFIKLQSNVSKAKAIMTVSKGMILYDVAFEVIYFSNGKPYTVDSIAKKTLAEHDFPSYFSQIMKNNRIEIKFDENDLQTLYNESQVVIVNDTAYNAIESTCKSNMIEKIRLIDRVFYTRVEYLGVNDEVKGAEHFGKINGLPNDVANAVYPFKTYVAKI